MTEFSRTVAAHLTAMLTTSRRRLEAARRHERGSVTLENLLWAILIVGLVALVGAAITAFINSKIGQLN